MVFDALNNSRLEMVGVSLFVVLLLAVLVTCTAAARGVSRSWRASESRRAAEAVSQLHPLRRFARSPPTFPKSARWLAAMYMDAQQKLPRARTPSGLKPLDPLRDWIEVDQNRFAVEMALKKKALLVFPGKEGEKRYRESVYQSDTSPKTISAQWEVLEALFSLLPHQFPHSYRMTRGAKGKGKGRPIHELRLEDEPDAVIEVLETKDRWRVGDFADAPLVLASLIVQEDFILLRPGEPSKANPEAPSESRVQVQQHVFAGGTACFSFTEVGIHTIHKPVPGFHTHLEAIVSGRPFYRSNWNLTNGGVTTMDLRQGEGRSENEGNRIRKGAIPASDMWLKVEHQTLHRLPRSGYLLFSIHTYADRLPSLRHAPEAAEMLASLLFSLTPAQQKYRALENDDRREAICNFLRKIAREGGLG